VSAGAVGKRFFRDSQEECSRLREKDQAQREGRKWFGGLCAATHGAAIDPAWLKYLRMTATATVCTSFGFAMAADGRRSWDHNPTPRSREGESETVQKIFEIARRDAAFAYCIRGDTVNESVSWDIAAELQSSIASLSERRFASSTRFIQALCLDLEGRVELAKQRGQLDGYPTTEVSLAGYFRDSPCWVEVQFRPHRLGLSHQIVPRDCEPGRNFMSGSQILNQMIQWGDSRVAHLVDGLLSDENMTLETAACFARKYIEMCCSPLIRGLEPDGCKSIGGHVHVATVRPPSRSLGSMLRRWLGRGSSPQTGFQWVRPPILNPVVKNETK
jgi:hypothetical protein